MIPAAVLPLPANNGELESAATAMSENIILFIVFSFLDSFFFY
jgi:hypothetical protein